jgi:phenylacetate-CoA ligase
MKTIPSLLDRLRFATLGPRDWVIHLLCSRYTTFLWGFSMMKPRLLARSGQLRSRRAFFRAAKRVPAYAGYLLQAADGKMGLPETDKENYIKAHTTEARCCHGTMPMDRTMIDESSGSTGTPYNWVRSKRERLESQRFISYFSKYCYGTESRITINAFSMGSWATGINMGQALEANGIVKNTGPDLVKMLSTLRFFGPQYQYLILGYPPFLKHFIDVAEQEGFPFEQYRLDALVGGEGMSEGLRDYLLKRFRLVYSGYGATDLEIGIAGETPVAVAVRRLAWKDPTVKSALFGPDSRLPMLFQYNPLMHHIEVNQNRELLFTITRDSVLSPRIRYNVHDEGGVARFDELEAKLRDLGYNLRDLVPESGRLLRLPFLWIYGRRDSTISVMGANIYPEDLEQCLYAEPELARITRSYCLSLSEHGAQVRPCFLFEIEAEPSDELMHQFGTAMVKRLAELNADFREALHEYAQTLQPEIKLYRIGEGPFAANSGRIKQARLLKTSASGEVGARC